VELDEDIVLKGKLNTYLLISAEHNELLNAENI